MGVTPVDAAAREPEVVVAVSASHLRPAVGETVRLWATWRGGWPADIPWTGVDADAGITATVKPRAVGPLTIAAAGATITLDVQAAVNSAPVPMAGVVTPLHDVDADGCLDDRFPRLAGAWVVGCGESRLVDRAWHAQTRSRVELSRPVASPGTGPDALYHPKQGLWRLPAGEPDTSPSRPGGAPVGPPAIDRAHAAVPFADHVEAFALTDRARVHTDAQPWMGAPMALAWPFAAWVTADPVTGADVWVRDASARGRPLARNVGDERNVSGDGRWLAWTAPDGVLVEDMERGERRVYAADTGFYGGIGQWGPVVCWEDRAALVAGTGDIDIRCSDGVELRRPGQQLQPSRWGPWLLFREDGLTWLATAAALVLDDDDPRAAGAGPTVAGGYGGAHREGGVVFGFEWPAEGWRVWRWEDGDWKAGEALGTGAIRVESPNGDAIRLAPE